MIRTNKRGDMGSPCLSPLLDLKKHVGTSFNIKYNEVLVTQIIISVKNLLRNLKEINISSKNSQQTVS